MAFTPKVKIFRNGVDNAQALDRAGVAYKLLHLVRHAEGTHNVSKGYKLPEHHDARLTKKGIEQCARLSQSTTSLDRVQIIVTSPLTRTVQTSIHSFPSQLQRGVPFVALEECRETVNFTCDARRSISEIKGDFPMIDYSLLEHDHDDVWQKYEDKFGPQSAFTHERESKDHAHLQARASKFFTWIAGRAETELAVVTHSCFLWNVFAHSRLGGDLLDYERDLDLKNHMEQWFDNCEMRSVLVVFQ
ncbi:hypothetical protein CYMTET_20199 [Cymbomonas tetramitiformis]|uniref:Phosphoglycerate mutase-like protein n=1 Tax=Cymbomonas tetramitiformis TaxID=36881 RepID=A0AAE0G4J3_9CHLO|nr:hypothetical protein CYMTET_20199 [Cymbomonas tetramitiformis]